MAIRPHAMPGLAAPRPAQSRPTVPRPVAPDLAKTGRGDEMCHAILRVRTPSVRERTCKFTYKALRHRR